MKKVVLIISLIVSIAGYSQEIERFVIGSTGSESSSGSVTITSTVGETMIRTVEGATITVTEGFQQPEIRTIEIADLKVYTGITPNGDNVNDTWVIDGIERYPENTVQIYGRWGEKVWEGENYDNVNVIWTGLNRAGNELPEGTYIYFIELKNGPEVPSSWVQISR